MRVIRHLRDLPPSLRGVALAIGNFDGVHVGHQAVIAEAGRIAASLSLPHLVVTFEPHPRAVFRPDDPPFRLTPRRAKLELFATLGVAATVVFRFHRGFAAIAAEDFVRDMLVGGLGVRHIVVGDNFHFGRGRAGNPTMLIEHGAKLGFGVTAVAPARDAAGETYSSSRARDLLRVGEPEAAAAILGRPFAIFGHVRHGDHRGRLLGFPTANLALGDHLRPRVGVYAVRARTESGQVLDGVANLGERPTVGGRDVRLEAHLFDFAGDLYGRRLDVALLRFIRPEQKFPDLEALKRQIAADSAAARTLLGQVAP
ncbi:MAG: bifunctional riboflavin kinase/FAD synthetase [Proteobacteria bacterium]|nr:bifunctional riboflavin kinase/FAD synthetase [Pseudomonadota bacterium]